MGRASRQKKTSHKVTSTGSRRLESPAIPVASGVFHKQIIHILLITVLALLAYLNTFHAPFQFDEGNITENAIVKDLRYFAEPSKAASLPFYDAVKSRFIGYLTFAINYKLHNIDVTGYHIVNLAIHTINALLVYWIVVLTFRTPVIKLSGNHSQRLADVVALFSALLFVSHPLQTQAVTYIVQRLASLSTMFYLLSVASYAKSRLSTEKARQYFFYGISFLSAILAMKTKEIAFTLPITIAIYEMIFFEGKLTKRITYMIPLLLTIVIIPLTLLSGNNPVGSLISDVSEATRLQTTMSRTEYLFTQFRVIVTYIRLLFLPIGQNLDYDYPVYHSFFDQGVVLSFLFLASIITAGLYILYRYRNSAPYTRFISFGIFWFFLTLAVESSVIPIVDVIFEHRVYLPSVGAFIAIATSLFILMTKLKQNSLQKALLVMSGLIVVVLSSATYARNILWKDEIALWSDVAQKSPHKARAHNNLGKAYYDAGLLDKAAEQFHLALQGDPNNSEAHVNMGNIYRKRDVLDRAIKHYQIALQLKPYFPAAHYNAGIAYYEKGLFDKAIEHYQIALRQKPDYSEAYNNLGNAYFNKGLLDKARENYESSLRLEPNNAEAHNGLGSIYFTEGLLDKAIEHYRTAVQLKPNFAEAYKNLGIVYIRKGLRTDAIGELEMALKIKPNYAEARQVLESISKERPSLR